MSINILVKMNLCAVLCFVVCACTDFEKSDYDEASMDSNVLSESAIVEINPVGSYTEKFPAVPFKHTKIKLEKSVLVPMRDGIRLSTDIYSPADTSEALPVILIRTPYNKNGYRDYKRQDSVAHFFAAHGYVVVIQDVRGRYESEGDYTVSAADRADGYDMVDWLSKQNWSSSKIGTYGCSYLGENQIQLAAMRHPNHLAAIPQAAAGAYRGNFRQFGYFDGGVFDLQSGLPWFWGGGTKIHLKRPEGMTDEQFRLKSGQMKHHPVPGELNTEKAFQHLPIVDIINHYKGQPTDYENFVSHGLADSYWDRHNYVDDKDKFNVPALHVNAWFDYGATDTLALFNLFRKNAVSSKARDNQFAIISPFSHCNSEPAMSEQSKIGDRELGDTRLDYYGIYLNWFDYWLKGVANGVTQMPKVQYFSLGANQWRTAEQWPLPDTKYTKFYLHSDGTANSSMMAGGLDTAQIKDSSESDSFLYDPEFPVPTLGATTGAFDQREIEQRDDVLVYSTKPLEKPLDVSGPLSVVLYVSSSAKDTDFTVKLVDVYPDGTAFNVKESILRARYREGFDQEVFMEKDGVYKLQIDLHDTSNVFAVDHQIRLEVSSSNFPRFVRNLNTGGNNYDETEWLIAKNVVHHSIVYPSALILPVPVVTDENIH